MQFHLGNDLGSFIDAHKPGAGHSTPASGQWSGAVSDQTCPHPPQLIRYLSASIRAPSARALITHWSELS